jgi:DNA-binding transcriptional ArsR family regulator
MINHHAELDARFQALSDTTRRSIVERLGLGATSVSDLARPLDMSLPAVMQHLRVLEDSGLVTSTKAGRVRTCRLEPKALAATEGWITERRVGWERRLDRLGAYLDDQPSNRKPGRQR